MIVITVFLREVCCPCVTDFYRDVFVILGKILGVRYFDIYVGSVFLHLQRLWYLYGIGWFQGIFIIQAETEICLGITCCLP